MKKLKITPETAVLLFNNSNATGQQALTDQFGPELFTPKPITERIQTLSDAMAYLGVSASAFAEMTVNDLPDELAYKKLKIIVRALNECWLPDWTNSNEYKYWPYFKYNASSGFGFSRTNYADWDTATTVGSRLVFKSRELAIYAAEQFQDIYNDYLTIQPINQCNQSN